MAYNEKGDSPLDANGTVEKLESSHKRKFDEFAEKQSIEESISKIPKFEDNEKKLKSESTFVLKHVFENVANLEERGRAFQCEMVLSSLFHDFQPKSFFFHFRFMEIERNKFHLEFFVFCEPIKPVKDKWAIETNTKYSMMGNHGDNVIKTMKFCFHSDDGEGYSNFVEWKDINNYLIDGSLTVQVKVEILKITGFGEERIRKFDDSQKDDSDVILLVGETKFYVLKKYLALQSTYFKSLFFGKFGEFQKNEIELKDINPDDFQKFLELIHGESSVDDNTVAGILHLADMYDAPTAVRRCEEFLMKNSQKTMVQKLQLSLRCNLENLKSKCLSEITKMSDVESILAANLPELNLSTSKALLQKCIDFSNK